MGKFIYAIVIWAVAIGINTGLSFWWGDISPTEEYIWWQGWWQGLFVIGNFVRSFFVEGVLCKAVNYTWGYNVWWWITLVCICINLLTAPFKKAE